MNLFIDECLSPELARRVNIGGEFTAVHPRDLGRLREPDHLVLKRCLDEDRVIVTENAVDFRKLVGKMEVHPGLIILPSVDREGSWKLLEAALEYLKALGEPTSVMINHVLEVGEGGACAIYELP